jgi:hypothetical protein
MKDNSVLYDTIIFPISDQPLKLILDDVNNPLGFVEISNLCPIGWSILNLIDFESLIIKLGGYEVTGRHLKCTSVLWRSPYFLTTKNCGFNTPHRCCVFRKAERMSFWTLSAHITNISDSCLLIVGVRRIT